MDSERSNTFREEGLGGYQLFLIVTGVFTLKKKRTYSLKVLEDKKYNLDHLESPPWPLGNIWERLCNRRKINQLISFLEHTLFPEFLLWVIFAKKKSWTRNHHISVQLSLFCTPPPTPLQSTSEDSARTRGSRVYNPRPPGSYTRDALQEYYLKFCFLSFFFKSILVWINVEGNVLHTPLLSQVTEVSFLAYKLNNLLISENPIWKLMTVTSTW